MDRDIVSEVRKSALTLHGIYGSVQTYGEVYAEKKKNQNPAEFIDPKTWMGEDVRLHQMLTALDLAWKDFRLVVRTKTKKKTKRKTEARRKWIAEPSNQYFFFLFLFFF